MFTFLHRILKKKFKIVDEKRLSEIKCFFFIENLVSAYDNEERQILAWLLNFLLQPSSDQCS